MHNIYHMIWSAPEGTNEDAKTKIACRGLRRFNCG